MPANNEGSDPTRELVITRVFDAPRELVFKAWTDPEHMKHWWGPKGFTLPHCTIDLRPGGSIHFCMRSAEGQDMWCKGDYREVVPPERIVCTDYFSDPQGNLVPPANYGMPAWPMQTLLTVTFTEDQGKTTMTMRHAVISATDTFPAADRAGAEQGWGQSFDRLAEYLKEQRA